MNNKKEQKCECNWIVTSSSILKREIDVMCNLCRTRSIIRNPTSEELERAKDAQNRNYVWTGDLGRIAANEKPKQKRTRKVKEDVQIPIEAKVEKEANKKVEKKIEKKGIKK